MPEETTNAIVGIGEMKDIMPAEKSKQELSLVKDEDIKVTEKDDQKTEIPEIVDIVDIDVIKDLMPESKITTTSPVDLASENPSDIPSLDDTKYSNETESEVTEIVESVDLKKVDPAEKHEELGEKVSSEISEELANQLFPTTLATVTDDKVFEESVTPVTDHKVSENEVTPDDEIQQVEVETQSADVIKGKDQGSIDGETATLPKQEMSTHETEQKSDEIPMPIEEVSMHQSIDQVNEPSEVKETPNEDTKSIEEETLPVDQGTKEEIIVTESFPLTSITLKESSSSFSIEETSEKSEAEIEGFELTQEKEKQVPLSILVSSEVDKNKNVVSEDKTEVQSSNSEQKSDLEVYCDITSSCASSVF